MGGCEQLEAAKLKQAEELLKQSTHELEQFRCVIGLLCTERWWNVMHSPGLYKFCCCGVGCPDLTDGKFGCCRQVAETLSQRDQDSRAQLAMYGEKFAGLQGTISKSNEQFISFKKDSEKLAKRCKVQVYVGMPGL